MTRQQLGGVLTSLLRVTALAGARSCSRTMQWQHLKGFTQTQPTALRSVHHLWDSQLYQRSFATDASQANQTTRKEETQGDERPAPESSTSTNEEEGQCKSEQNLGALLEEKNVAIDSLTKKVLDLTDKLKRAYAEGENSRARLQREVEQTKQFAVQGFVKSVLEVADNLQRAAESVPDSILTPEGIESLDKEKAVSQLKNLLTGVQLTDKVLMQVLKQQGVASYNPLNEKFDPNLHSALFEVPDPSKEPGTIAVVTKRGYKLHDRVVRPAEVGVARAAS